MSLDRPRPIGSLDNRLSFAEVRRALFRTTEGFFLFFGMFFGGIPLVIASVFVAGAVRDARLLHEGQPAVGKVVAKHIHSDDDGTSYRIYYEYVTSEGRTFGDSFSASSREYYSLREGDALAVRYEASNPLRSAVVDHGGVPLRWVLPFLSLFILVGGALFVVGARRLRRRLRVYRSGLPAWGKNLGIREDPSMRVNGRPCRVLEFEYVDLQGATRVCRSSYLSADMIARLENLDPVPVVYVPDRPDEADLDLDRL